MQIFIDSADLDQLRKYIQWGIVDGVTTNPTIIFQSQASLKTRIQEICSIVSGPVSSEVTVEDAESMVRQGVEMASWASNVYVKVPCTPNGLIAAKELSSQGINVNVTLVFNPLQALLAAKAGATLVSPFVGRLDDISEDGLGLLAEIVQIYANYGFETKVLSASIRTLQHVIESARIGADIITLPPKLLDQMMIHPLTTSGLEKFMEDAKSITF